MTPHPRALAGWCAAAVASSLMATNPIHRVLLLLVALNVCLHLRRPEARLQPIMVGIAIAAVVGLAVNVLLSHGGDHVITAIPNWVPGLGGAVTVESIVYGACLGAGIGAATLSVVPLLLAVDADELVDALPRHLERTGAALGGALNLVPRLLRTTTDIRESHRVRGWQPSRSPRLREILVPAFLSALEDSVQLAEAMEARGFGAGTRTRWLQRQWTSADVAVLIAAAGAVTVEIIGRVTGNLGDWFPFPALSMPAFSIASLVAAVLLMTPVVVWKTT